MISCWVSHPHTKPVGHHLTFFNQCLQPELLFVCEDISIIFCSVQCVRHLIALSVFQHNLSLLNKSEQNKKLFELCVKICFMLRKLRKRVSNRLKPRIFLLFQVLAETKFAKVLQSKYHKAGVSHPYTLAMTCVPSLSLLAVQVLVFFPFSPLRPLQPRLEHTMFRTGHESHKNVCSPVQTSAQNALYLPWRISFIRAA